MDFTGFPVEFHQILHDQKPDRPQEESPESEKPESHIHGDKGLKRRKPHMISHDPGFQNFPDRAARRVEPYDDGSPAPLFFYKQDKSPRNHHRPGSEKRQRVQKPDADSQKEGIRISGQSAAVITMRMACAFSQAAPTVVRRRPASESSR